MSEPIKPLKKPPGYRDPSIPIQMPPQAHRPAAYARNPKHPPPSLYPPRRRRRNCCWRCCCYLILFLIFVILLLIVCGAIFFVWFNPKLPVFHLTSLDFTKFAVTNSPDGGSSLNAQGTLGVEMKNPNKQLKMVYGRTKLELRGVGRSEDMSLGKGSVGGFVQKPGNVRELKVRIRSKELLFGKSARNVGDRFKRKTLKVNAEVKTGIGIGFSGGWSAGPIGITVRCKGLSLKHISDGSSRKCHVKLLNLVDIS